MLGGAHGVGIRVCNIQFLWIAVLKIRVYMYVSYMFGGAHRGSDRILIYNSVPACVVKR